MKKTLPIKLLHTSLLAALATTSLTHADFVDVRFEVVPGGPPDTVTCRAIARFDNGNDAFSAVRGFLEYPLAWSTNAASGMINDNPVNDGSTRADVPLNGPHDTWVTVAMADNILFSPSFSACLPPNDDQNLTDGCVGFSNTSGAYSLVGAPQLLSSLDPGGNTVNGYDVVIAQFTVSEDCGASSMSYSGSIAYEPDNGSPPLAIDPFLAERRGRNWFEDFDDDALGALVRHDGWEAWGAIPAAANFQVTTDQADSVPHSLAITGGDNAVHRFAGHDANLSRFTAMVWVPQAMDDLQILALLNTYPIVALNGWSLLIAIDGQNDVLKDLASSAQLPLIRCRWTEVRVDIDFDADEQSVFYEGQHLVTKSLSGGFAPGGAVNLAAVDFNGNGSAHEVYYDDLSLEHFSFTCPPDSPFAPEPDDEGAVRFYKGADNDFGQNYLVDCPSDTWLWMLDHYFRMQVYPPWFDCHTQGYRYGLAYMDMYAIYDCAECDPNCADCDGCWVGHCNDYLFVTENHQEWILVGESDEQLFIPYTNAEGTYTQFAADIGNPAFRAYWISKAGEKLAGGDSLGLFAGGDYLGLFVDDVNLDLSKSVVNGDGDPTTPVDLRTGDLMTSSDWQRYLAEFVEDIRAAFPGREIIHNSVWFHETDWTNGFLQRQVDAADRVMLERGANDPGFNTPACLETDCLERFFDFNDGVHDRGRSVVHACKVNGEPSPLDTLRQLEYGLAGWLLISTGWDIYNSQTLSDPDNWWTGFDVDLGEALDDRYEWMGVLRRDFERGIVLFNGPDGGSRSITLPQPHSLLDGALVDDVSLESNMAVILQELPCEPQCPADFDGDGVVGIVDFLTLLNAWGSNPGGPPDFDGDGTVGITDLLTLLANWGPCS